MPIRRRCLITEFINSNCTAFVASFQRTSALSFTEPSPHPSPSSSVDLKQTRMFSIMADEAADVSNKENLLLSSAMSTLRRIFERSFLVSAIVEKKQLVTQWIKEFNN